MSKYRAANDDHPSWERHGFNYTTSAVGRVVETLLVAFALLGLVGYAVVKVCWALADKFAVFF